MKAKKIFITFFTGVFLIMTAMLLPLMASEKGSPPVKSAALEGKLNVNTATLKELKMLPGVGKTTANNIMEYRKQNGKFRKVEDLLKVQGVGKRTVAKIKDYVIVDGKSTLAKK